MVKLLPAIALAVTGCLSKPPLPLERDASDGDAAPDAGNCPAGTTPFPSNLLLRRVSELGRYDADAADDVFVWGREGGTSGMPFAYVVRGREPMNLDCYERSFPFGGPTVEPLDVWSGDATGDLIPDLLLAGRDDGPETYPIQLYKGVSGGGVAPGPETRVLPDTYPANIGMTISMPFPAFLAAVHKGTQHEILFGGLDEPFAAMPYTTAIGVDLPMRDAADGSLGITAVQEVSVLLPPATPEQVIVVTSDSVYTLEPVGRSALASRFVQRTADNFTQSFPRSARFARRTLGNHTIGVTQYDPDDFLFVRMNGAPPILLDILDVQVPRADIEDMALANVDDNPALDLVVLTGEGVAQLIVFPNLVFDNPSPVTSGSAIMKSFPLTSNILAVGDFDGSTSTPDQILVLGTSVNRSLGSCFHVVPSVPLPCFAACGSTTCQ